MIEETHPNDDSYIVCVKAVVMVRDDSSGGWLAQDGGALSRVGVCRVLPPELGLGLTPLGRSHFLIHGERLRDKQVILECALRKNLVYTKATPTFHHWMVEDRRCGLTFQRPADARAFDRGVRKAMEDMTEGSTTSSSTLQNEAELGDDDVFTNATDSSSNSSSKRLEPCLQPLDSSPLADSSHLHNNCILGNDLHEPYRLSDHYFLDLHLPRIPHHVTFHDDEDIIRINPRERSWELPSESSSRSERRVDQLERSWLTGYEDYRHATVRHKYIRPPDDSESYVHFAKSEPHKHHYSYPLVSTPLDSSDPKPTFRPLPKRHHYAGLGSQHRRPGEQGFGGGVVSTQPQPLLPGSSDGQDKKSEEGGVGESLQCQYCGETFYRGNNRRGRCQDAPDPIRACVRRVSCMWLADTLLYHCMSDPEGDYSDPCSCEGGGEGRLGTRWAALLGLSLVAPCLCLYPPLHACHRAGVACGVCGGRHEASMT